MNFYIERLRANIKAVQQMLAGLDAGINAAMKPGWIGLRNEVRQRRTLERQLRDLTAQLAVAEKS